MIGEVCQMPLIYILEDDNSVRELESYALQGNGYEVRGFDQPKPFYEELKKTSVPFCITKIIMVFRQ